MIRILSVFVILTTFSIGNAGSRCATVGKEGICYFSLGYDSDCKSWSGRQFSIKPDLEQRIETICYDNGYRGLSGVRIKFYDLDGAYCRAQAKFTCGED